MSNPKGKSIEITIPSDPEVMGIVRAVISKAVEKVCECPNEINRLILAVDEACTNIIKHCYQGCPDNKISLTVTVFEKQLEIRLRDYGRKHDTRTFRARDLKDIKPGGLGMHFIQEIMDKVEYDTSHEVGTEMILTKFFDCKNKSEKDDNEN